MKRTLSYGCAHGVVIGGGEPFGPPGGAGGGEGLDVGAVGGPVFFAGAAADYDIGAGRQLGTQVLDFFGREVHGGASAIAIVCGFEEARAVPSGGGGDGAWFGVRPADPVRDARLM